MQGMCPGHRWYILGRWSLIILCLQCCNSPGSKFVLLCQKLSFPLPIDIWIIAVTYHGCHKQHGVVSVQSDMPVSCNFFLKWLVEILGSQCLVFVSQILCLIEISVCFQHVSDMVWIILRTYCNMQTKIEKYDLLYNTLLFMENNIWDPLAQFIVIFADVHVPNESESALWLLMSWHIFAYRTSSTTLHAQCCLAFHIIDDILVGWSVAHLVLSKWLVHMTISMALNAGLLQAWIGRQYNWHLLCIISKQPRAGCLVAFHLHSLIELQWVCKIHHQFW